MGVFLDLTEDLHILAEFLACLWVSGAAEATLRILATADALLELNKRLLLFLLKDLHLWCLVLLTKGEGAAGATLNQLFLLISRYVLLYWWFLWGLLRHLNFLFLINYFRFEFLLLLIFDVDFQGSQGQIRLSFLKGLALVEGELFLADVILDHENVLQLLHHTLLLLLRTSFRQYW